MTIFLWFVSLSSVFAASQHITPADKEKIFRHIGDSVLVECKNLSPFSRNCQVNCGNGRQYRKAKGYCHYLSEGKFRLSVSTRYRGKNFSHRALVVVKGNAVTSNQRPHIERRVVSTAAPVSPRVNQGNLHRPQQILSSGSVQAATPQNDSNTGVGQVSGTIQTIPTSNPAPNPGQVQLVGNDLNTVTITDVTRDENLLQNEFGQQSSFVDNNLSNNVSNQNSFAPPGGFGGNSNNFGIQNNQQQQFAQQ